MRLTQHRAGDWIVHERELSDGSWRVSYWVPDAEGQPVRKRTRLTEKYTRKEAEARAQQLAREYTRMARRRQEGTGGYLVQQLVAAYETRAALVSQAQTVYHYQGSLMAWLAFWIDLQAGWRPGKAIRAVASYGRAREDRWRAILAKAGALRSQASSVKAKDVQLFLVWMGLQVAAATVNSAAREVRGLFSTLVLWDVIGRNPFTGVALLDRKKRTPGATVDPRRRKGFTDEEEAQIFAALWGPPLPAACRVPTDRQEELAIYAELLCRTGHRADQVYRMRWDPRAGRLHFHGQKGGPDSTLPTTPAVAALLLRRQTITGGQWTFRLDWYLHRLGWVNTALGITGVPRAHGWRHTMVRRIVNAAGHDWARKVVGHSLASEGMSGEYFEADAGTEARVLQLLLGIDHPRPATALKSATSEPQFQDAAAGEST